MFSLECQAGFRAFFQQLLEANVIAHPVTFAMDRVGTSGALVEEFVLPFAQISGPAIEAIVAAWLQGRAGRALRLKVGNIKVHATITRKLEQFDLGNRAAGPNVTPVSERD